jgi:hypothetical protein
LKKITFFSFFLILYAIGFTQSDTIIVKNRVGFNIYNNQSLVNVDVVEFTLEVNNHSSNPIPNLGATNRSQYVNFYINGKIDNPLSLYNGTESAFGDKTIAVNQSENFVVTWVLNEKSGIVETYGNEFTVQWEYCGIKSEIVKVNLQDKASVTITN